MNVKRNRRRFIHSSIGMSLGAAAAVGIDNRVPRYLCQAADLSAEKTDKVLVVIQLSGGNDGLNTVVPFANDDYYKARPKLALPESDILRINDQLGFHPSLQGLHELHEEGSLTTIQGIGYDRPNRSHFESMDIWHTCRRKDEARADGWLGRFLDQSASRSDVPGLHFGDSKQPLSLRSRNVRVPSVQSLDEFRLKGINEASIERLIGDSSESAAEHANDLLGFVQTSTATALVASQQVEKALSSYETEVTYSDTRLSKQLSIIAQLIDSGLGTRIYYVELDGFDTHAAQANTHAILLREWSEAVTSFVRDLDEHGHSRRVCVMTFSEFGRRVAENASAGTDHGAAAPLFLAGGGLNGGIVGSHPSMTDLQDGDLKFSVDFRRVYSSVVRDWLAADAQQVVGGTYEPMELFKALV